MTRRDTLKCIHEPFGDAFYFGPERLSSRFEEHDQARSDSGFEYSTFESVLDGIERAGAEVRNILPSVALFYTTLSPLQRHAKQMQSFIQQTPPTRY